MIDNLKLQKENAEMSYQKELDEKEKKLKEKDSDLKDQKRELNDAIRNIKDKTANQNSPPDLMQPCHNTRVN